MATGPSTEISLLSLADGKASLGSTGDTDNDGAIADQINALSARFETETGRKLKSREHTEYYDGNGRSYLYLTNYPLASTTIVITIDEARAFDDTGDVVTSTDVILSTEEALVRLDGHTFTSGKANVKIVYTAGYTTDVEFTLVQAAKDFLQILWNRWDRKDMIGVRSESYEGGSRTYESDMPWSVKKILDTYKDRRVV